uniref:duboraya isoform X2 n=1 Tax=Monopterus albus TaxID=43700 RepID=UPI0009B40826|nr:capZ-interacting protein-like isoform X2 [Monopterus albus]
MSSSGCHISLHMALCAGQTAGIYLGVILPQEEAPSRRSVAELAGRFSGAAPVHDAAGKETDKPVRRRPPRSLHIPKPHEDQQEPPGVTSPQPTKAKRNSALIEKLQANLALSPSTLLPSPKSPGIRVLSPTFTLPSSTSAPSPATPTTPLTEEEGPATFEAPLSAVEGSILQSVNKSRPRHSVRRRPPSRRHRKSSSGDEVGVTNGVANTTQDETTTGEERGEEEGRGGGEGEVFKKEGETDEVVEDKTDTSMCPEKTEEGQKRTEPKEDYEEEEEGKNRSMGGEGGSSSGRKEEEDQEKNQNEVSTEVVTNTDSKEEKSEETPSQSSAQ